MCALIETSRHPQHLAATICMMLGCSAALSSSCPDLIRLSPMKTLSEAPSFRLLSAKLNPAFPLADVPRCISISVLALNIPTDHLRLPSQGRILQAIPSQNPRIVPASCHACPFIVLCPSYPQYIVLRPLILTRNAAKVIAVIPVRRGLPNPSPKEVALAQAQEGSDTRLQVLL